MKTLTAFLIVAVSAAAADTNRFPILKAGSLTYTNARVTLKTPAYIIIWHDGGGSRVMLTNLSPELQKRFGYDAVKASESSRQDAEKAERAKAEYRARSLAAGKQREYLNALARARADYQAKRQAIEGPVQADMKEMDAVMNQISNLRTRRDTAWNRYVTTDSSYYSQRNNQVDNDATRLQLAQSLDNQIIAAQARFNLLEKRLDVGQAREEKELPQVEADYREALKKIQETFFPSASPPDAEK